MAEIEIEIDGKKLKAEANQTVIQVADNAGIYIPRFCYHPHLSIPANCRMCLVELEKSPKPVPACATPVMPGMKISTKSQKTVLAQKAVMEFLLINHPLDCPICDQGGECELQDLAMGYGSSHSHYDECKRAVADEDLGPLIASDMTRCIQCTRCVRFGDEIAGLRELGVMYRGEDEAIQTYVKQAITSEVSGNIIDLCPVGALTSKPYRFTARPWELNQTPSISPHDCIGANIFVHTRYEKVMRVVPRENKTVNETWISDRDRFSYTGLSHPHRLETPMMKMDGEWQAVSWQQALDFIANEWRDIIATHGADKIGALISPSATVEECYLLQKWMRALGSPHIDHRLREIDMSDQAEMPLFPGSEIAITEIAECDAIILIGSHLHKEQPLAALQVRKASLKGAAVIAINPMDYRFHFPLAAKKILAPQVLPQALAAMANAFETLFSEVSSDDFLKQPLIDKKKVCVILGAQVMHHPQAAFIRYITQKIAVQINAKIIMMTDGGNAAGAWLAGAVPHRHAAGESIHHVGLDAQAMLHKPRKAYALLNIEPTDCADPVLMEEALKQAQSVVALSLYRNTVLEKYAQVILPIAAWTETAGTLVNVTGEIQSFVGVAKPYGESRPAWKILRVLANFFALEGFDYTSAEEVKHEWLQFMHQKAVGMKLSYSHFSAKSFPSVKEKIISRIGEIPLYAVDSIVRHASPLQKMQTITDNHLLTARMHPDTAAYLRVAEGQTVRVRQHGSEITLPVVLDTRVALQAVYIPGGIEKTAMLRELLGEVEIN
jgi:NADH-quinone oxidoreductase subunit G